MMYKNNKNRVKMKTLNVDALNYCVYLRSLVDGRVSNENVKNGSVQDFLVRGSMLILAT